MTEIEIIEKTITLLRLKEIGSAKFGDMVKAVVDLEKKIMAVGGELHADEEALLLDQGSRPQDLWGINIYVNEPRASFIEFDSMINLRPSQGNLSRNVQNPEIREKIQNIVNSLVT